MEEKFEILGQLIDQLDSLAHGLNIPMDAQTHVDQLKLHLPCRVEELKKCFQTITGENPWE